MCPTQVRRLVESLAGEVSVCKAQAAKAEATAAEATSRAEAERQV